MKFGLDIDGVVADASTAITNFLKEKYDIDWPAENFSTYWFKDWKLTDDPELQEKIVNDLIALVNDDEFQSSLKPYPEARENVQKLRKAGHKIYFITARPKQNQPATFKWLRKHGIPFDGLRVIGHKADKGFYGRQLKLDMFVDDLESNLENMLEYKSRWRKGLLLFDQPYNQTADESKFIRVSNWEEVFRHIGVQNR